MNGKRKILLSSITVETDSERLEFCVVNVFSSLSLGYHVVRMHTGPIAYCTTS